MSQPLRISLQGPDNLTYSGILQISDDILWSAEGTTTNGTMNTTTYEEPYDHAGASTYVIAVVMVYGVSIVLLIGSHINRRHEKIAEDKQIDKYLMDFQVVRDKQDRDDYRDLKKTIIAQFNLEKSIRNRDTFINIQKTAVSLLAVGIPGAGPSSPSGKRSDNKLRPSAAPSPSNISHPERLRQLRLQYRDQDNPPHGLTTSHEDGYTPSTSEVPRRGRLSPRSPTTLTVSGESPSFRRPSIVLSGPDDESEDESEALYWQYNGEV